MQTKPKRPRGRPANVKAGQANASKKATASKKAAAKAKSKAQAKMGASFSRMGLRGGRKRIAHGFAAWAGKQAKMGGVLKEAGEAVVPKVATTAKAAVPEVATTAIVSTEAKTSFINIPDDLPEAAHPQGERSGSQTYTIKGTDSNGELNGCSIEVHLKLSKFYLNRIHKESDRVMLKNREQKAKDPQCEWSVPRNVPFKWFDSLPEAWDWVADKTMFFGPTP